MTNYNLAKDTTALHECTSDLAQLRSHDANITWECTVCRRLIFLEDVVEMLRVRAVAQDAASRVHHRPRGEERVEFLPVGAQRDAPDLAEMRRAGVI